MTNYDSIIILLFQNVVEKNLMIHKGIIANWTWEISWNMITREIREKGASEQIISFLDTISIVSYIELPPTLAGSLLYPDASQAPLVPRGDPVSFIPSESAHTCLANTASLVHTYAHLPRALPFIVFSFPILLFRHLHVLR